MKTVYWQTIKRKFKKGGIVYARRISKNEKRYHPDPAEGYDLTWLDGVEVSVQLWGSEPGSHDIGEIYMVPTLAESELCGFGLKMFIPMRTRW